MPVIARDFWASSRAKNRSKNNKLRFSLMSSDSPAIPDLAYHVLTVLTVR